MINEWTFVWSTKYRIQKTEFRSQTSEHRGQKTDARSQNQIQNPQSKTCPRLRSGSQNRNMVSPSLPTTKQKTSSSTPCWHPRTWVEIVRIEVILSPWTQAGTYM